MKTTCPKCGSRTEELTQKTRNADAIDVFFKCTNRQCGAAVTGLLTLAVTRTDRPIVLPVTCRPMIRGVSRPTADRTRRGPGHAPGTALFAPLYSLPREN